MPKLYPEALAFCLAWAALAIAAGIMASVWLGILFSGACFGPDAALRDDHHEDREFRAGAPGALGLLVLAALALAVWLRLAGTSASALAGDPQPSC